MATWQIVKRRGQRKQHVASEQVESARYVTPNPTKFSIEGRDKILKWTAAAKENVRKSSMLSAFKKSFTCLLERHDIEQSFNCILIYGLGGLDSSISRYQLGFILEIKHWLGLPKIEAFDPAFSDLDKRTLQHLGIHVIQENEHAARILTEKTLVYMPHCEADLNENMVSTNFVGGSLKYLVLISNHLPRYKELFDDESEMMPRYPKPATIIDLCSNGKIVYSHLEERELEATRAFNDTSIHIFLE